MMIMLENDDDDEYVVHDGDNCDSDAGYDVDDGKDEDG